MDAGTMAQWAAVGISFAALLIAWLNRRSEKIEDIEKRQDRFDARLQKVEGDVIHLPSKDLVHALQLAIAKLESKIDVVATRVEPIRAISDRLQEAILEGAPRK